MKVVYCTDMDYKNVRSVLNDGKLIVYPTDTLYALGADPFKKVSIINLFKAKKRDMGLPVSIAFSSVKRMEDMVEIDDVAMRVIERHMPGPLTLLLPAKDNVRLPNGLVSPKGKIGVRIPDDRCALSLLREVGPLTATSANVHGGEDPTSIEEVMDQLGSSASIYISGGPRPDTGGSTIVDILDGELTVVREGVLKKEELEDPYGF